MKLIISVVSVLHCRIIVNALGKTIIDFAKNNYVACYYIRYVRVYKNNFVVCF